MLRPLYRCVLRLHPSGFRTRFADEMLSIFDHTTETAATVRLLADGLISLLRQWTLRPEFRHQLSPAQQPVPDGVPSFHTLDPFRPTAGAVIHGLVLSTVVFCMTCFAIRYSWIHVLHVRIPEVVFASPRSIQMSTGTVSKENSNLSTTPGSSVNVPAPVSTSPLPVQSPVAQNHGFQSPAEDMQRSQGDADARSTVEALGQPKRNEARESERTGNIKSAVVPQVERTGIAAVQTQQSNALDATGASSTPMVEDFKLDAAERQRVIHGAIANLTKYYVNSDVAQTMSDTLLTHEKNGDDDTATDGEVFADLLTKQMTDAGHDQYVVMVYSKAASLEQQLAPSPEEVARYRKVMEQNNCTIKTVEILPHNIGYLKFDAFPDATICGRTVAAAMASLNDADAIIFDLRDNRGGYANMVALIATYLFDRPAHLNDFYDRGANSMEQSWTLPPIPGNRLAEKPAFVLTSPTTFSAAEAFSYDLKMLKRATLVGETTSGRGHIGMGHRIDDHFTIRVPGMRVVNPISNTNWEGTGVEPDVKVKAADALLTAEQLAQNRQQKN